MNAKYGRLVISNCLRSALVYQNRTFKNFGHKRQPESHFTTLWHGFLTFTFIGLGINWKWVSTVFLGTKVDPDMATPLDR